MSIDAMKLALEALEETRNALAWFYDSYPQDVTAKGNELLPHVETVLTTLRQAIEQAEQPKYRRGDRLVCLETEEFCVIHISGTDRQWVKFPDTQVYVFTNQQVAELFELLPKEIEQAEQAQPVTYDKTKLNCFAQDLYDQKMREGKHGHYEAMFHVIHQCIKRVAPPPRKPLTDEEISNLWDGHTIPVFGKTGINPIVFARAIEAAHGIKEKNNG